VGDLTFQEKLTDRSGISAAVPVRRANQVSLVRQLGKKTHKRADYILADLALALPAAEAAGRKKRPFSMHAARRNYGDGAQNFSMRASLAKNNVRKSSVA
jgi:hypothetical protein